MFLEQVINYSKAHKVTLKYVQTCQQAQAKKGNSFKEKRYVAIPLISIRQCPQGKLRNGLFGKQIQIFKVNY